MPRHLAIETAYHRNEQDPLTVTIDGIELRVNPALLDVGQAAILFAKFQDGLAAVGDEAQSLEARLTALTTKRDEGIDALRACIVDDDQEKFDGISAHIDFRSLSQTVTWVLTEVSGMDPTRPESSSDGSSTDGPPSTDGAPPEVSMPSLSPSTEG